MTYKLVISDLAFAHIEDTWEWYRQTSGDPEIADHWSSGLFVQLRTLSQNPDRFSLAWEADDLGIVLRELHYGSGKRPTHRALFCIRGDVVEILAIRHHAQRDVTARDLGLE